MADERLLKEYDGIKDGEIVHLSIKAGMASTPTQTATVNPPQPNPIAKLPSPSLSTPSNTAEFTKSRSDSLSAPFSPSSSMGPPKSRVSSGSSRPSGAGHSRVPSITLTTDFTNFNNLAGNVASPHDGNHSAGFPSPGRGATHGHSKSPSLGGSAGASFGHSSGGNGGLPGMAGQGGTGRQSPDPFTVTSPTPHSGDSTPLSTPGTPMSGIVGFGRTRSPSITVPIDLENIEMLNPLSSDRTHPVGLSPAFLGTVKDPKFWNDILTLLDGKFKEGDKRKQNNNIDENGNEYEEETKRVFELWLAASKDWMNASDIARIRDETGLWGMAGR